MITQKLIEYIRQRVEDGDLRENITKDLLAVGWGIADVNNAFNASEVIAVAATPISSMPQTTKSFLPPTSVQTTSVPVSPPVMRDSFWYRPIIIILVLVVLVGIAGGGVYAYYIYAKQPSAVAVLRGIFENKAPIQSFDFTATSTAYTTINIASSSPSISAGNFLSDLKSIHTTTVFTNNGTFVTGESGTHPTFDMVMALQSSVSAGSAGGTYSLGVRALLSSGALDLKLLRGNINIKSDNTQIRMGTAFINVALSKMVGKWVRAVDFTDASSSVETSKIFSSFSATSSPDVAKDLKDLRAYVYSLKYLRSAKNIGIEYLGGVPTYHLSLVIQNTQASALLAQRLLFSYIQSLPGYDKQSMSFGTFLQDTNSLDKAFTQTTPLDVWIGKNDSRIYKISIPKITFTETNSAYNTNTVTQQDFSFTHYNNTSPIVPPKNPESRKSFLRGMFGQGNVL